MKKVFIFSITAVLLLSCASKSKPIVNIPLMQAVEPVKNEPSNPYDFEKRIPESQVIRKSLISFGKTYQRVYSDSDVIGISAGSEMLSVLKNDEIGFTMPYCSGLALNTVYNGVKVAGLDALLYNNSRIEVFSAEECASIGVYKRLLKGGMELIKGYVIEWEGSKAALRNIYNGDILFNDDTGIPIVAAGVMKGKPALLQNNGYLLTYNPSFKAFSLESRLPSGYEYIYHSEGLFYGTLLDKGKFFVLSADDVKVSDETGCKASPFSVSGLCGSVLITDKEKFHDVPQGDAFAAGKGVYMVLQKGNLNIYYLVTEWQRFISMSFSIPKPCSYKNDVYYKSFSGSVFKMSKGLESVSGGIPNGCSYKNTVLNQGNFYCGGKECGKFSSRIKSSEDAVMFRRIEDNKIYYYFENIEK